jgi:hypothetical protein
LLIPLIQPVSNRDLLKSYLQNPSSLNSEVSQSQQHTGTTGSLTKDINKPLDRSDYPQILFWFRQDWLHYERENSGATRLLSKGKGRPGENISMRYIEGEDGNVIDGYRASEIRKFARSIWMQLANNSKAPKTWGKTDLESAKHYRQEMVRRFPELRLCAFDWKADQVATDNYPNWASTYLNTGRIKDEVLGDTESSSLNSVPAKRPHV